MQSGGRNELVALQEQREGELSRNLMNMRERVRGTVHLAGVCSCGTMKTWGHSLNFILSGMGSIVSFKQRAHMSQIF